MKPYSVPRGVSRPSASLGVAVRCGAGGAVSAGPGGVDCAVAASLTQVDRISIAATRVSARETRKGAIATPEPLALLHLDVGQPHRLARAVFEHHRVLLLVERQLRRLRHLPLARAG